MIARRVAALAAAAVTAVTAFAAAVTAGCSNCGHSARERGTDDPARASGERAHEPGGAGSGPAARWHYTFRPAADLATMTVDLCFWGAVPALLDAQMPAARESLIRAERLPAGRQPGEAGEAGEGLGRGPDGIDLSALAPGDCVRHVLDLTATVERASGERGVRRFGDDLLLSPDYWLWKPAGVTAGGNDRARGPAPVVTAEFALPEGVAIAVPWPREDPDGRYTVPPSAFEWKAHGAIGRFAIDALEVPGATLRVSRLGDGWRLPLADAHAWLRRAAGAVAALYGVFPAEVAQVVLVPVRGDGISFGYARSGGGPGVVILTGRQCDASALRDDWVAVHELLHLGIPFLQTEAAWLYEGLATYYEPVLRARAGLLTPREAWERLHEGFVRGSSRGSGRTLRGETEHMSQTHQYWRVYWSGAAIALLADVALRAMSDRSLDDEMRALRTCCLSVLRKWTGEALLAEVARAAGTSALADVSANYLDNDKFPEYSVAYKVLGLVFDDRGKVTVTGGDAARALRRAIMGRDVDEPADAPRP